MASEISKLLDKASMYVDIARYDEAKAAYEAVVEQEPDNADAWYGIGRIHLVVPPNRTAGDCFQRAIKIRPNFAAAHHGLGIIQMRQGNNRGALTSVDRAIALDSLDDVNMARVHNTRGNVLCNLRRRVDAREAFKRAIALNPDYALPYNGLGNLYLEVDNVERAIELYRRVIARSGVADHIKAVSHYNLARSYRKIGNFDLAIQNMGMAMTLDKYDKQYPEYVERYKKEQRKSWRYRFGRIRDVVQTILERVRR